MYCSTCGKSLVPGLAYCNHCGAKLAGQQNQVAVHTDSGTDSLIWAIVGVFCGGIGVLIGLLAVMKKELGFDLPFLLFFSLLTFGLITAIEAVFVWMLFSRNRAANRALAIAEQRATKELDAAPARMLAEPIPMQSVTEHTTRSFEPIYQERK
jgi:H+/Cl- antiporter ClcA